MSKDIRITPICGCIDFIDTVSQATIIEKNGDLYINSNNNSIIIGSGNTANVQFGDNLTSIEVSLLGGGSINSCSNTLNIGSYGDTINLNVVGVTYNLPSNLITTSDYTANDILYKIKIVDGSSSGLDADLLDGQHGSYYLSSSCINGNTNYIPKFNLSNSLNNSVIYNVGTCVGINTNSPSTNLDVTGSGYISNNLTIGGNLTICGNQFITCSETVLIKDNVLTINNGEIGAGVTKSFSGTIVNRGSLNNYALIFDEVRDGFAIGEITGETTVSISNLQLVATRENNPINNGIAIWNTSTNKFNTSLSPTLNNIKITNLSDNYLPYHVNDTIGLCDSIIYYNGTNVGVNTTSPNMRFTVNGAISGSTYVYGNIICANTCYIGNGSGLIGTASSFSVGCATNSTNSTCLNGQLASYYAISSHVHGCITNSGNIGTISGCILCTGTNGCIGITSNVSCSINSTNSICLNGQLASYYATSSHVHGCITNSGNIGTISGCVLCTGTDGCITVTSSVNCAINSTNSVNSVNSTNSTNSTCLNGQLASYYATSSHVHGCITNSGNIGTISGCVLCTGLNGCIGVTSTVTPSSHVHGCINNGACIGTILGCVLCTGTDGCITVTSSVNCAINSTNSVNSVNSTNSTNSTCLNGQLASYYAISSHVHGCITNSGNIGTTSGCVLCTGTNGCIGITSNVSCSINSTNSVNSTCLNGQLASYYAVSSHVHGNISNSGNIGTTSGCVLCTGTNGCITVTSSVANSNNSTCLNGQLANYYATSSHVHGCITNSGNIGTISGCVLCTGLNGCITITSSVANSNNSTCLNGQLASYYAISSHVHGCITNSGNIGTISGCVLCTGTNGCIGITSNVSCSINSTNSVNSTCLNGQLASYYAVSSHEHGNINNCGCIGTTSGYVLCTGTNGCIGITSNVSCSINSNTSICLCSIDNRDIVTTPETMIAPGLKVEFKSNTTECLCDGGDYFGEISLRPYGYYDTDWSGGPAHQLGFTTNGNIYHRYGTGILWNNWKYLINSNNISGQTVKNSICLNGQLASYYATSSHVHGCITNSGNIGTTSGCVLCTGLNGCIGVTSTVTPSSHVHGCINNGACIGTILGCVLCTGTDGCITVTSSVNCAINSTNSVNSVNSTNSTNSTCLNGQLASYYATSSHVHGCITNSGNIGTTSGCVLCTGLNGCIGVTSNVSCSINSTNSVNSACLNGQLASYYATSSHVHGCITNSGNIGTTSGCVLCTGTNGCIGVTSNVSCSINSTNSVNSTCLNGQLASYYATSSHVHGCITNSGNIGTTSGCVLCTGTNGCIGVTSTVTPSSHVHGCITNSGNIGTISGCVLCTGTNGCIGVTSTVTPSPHMHGNITNDGKICNISGQILVTGGDGCITIADNVSCAINSQNLIGDSGIIQRNLCGYNINNVYQIRETYGGSGLTDLDYSPTLGWNWDGTISSMISMDELGNFRFINSNNTDYRNIRVNCGIGYDWIASSDIRLKKDIEIISDPISIINKLKGVSYKLCNDIDSKCRIGLIAQDTINVLPEVVYKDKIYNNKYKDYMYGISYDKITALLIEAIKNQQIEIDTLKNNIDNLNSIINAYTK